MTYDDFKSLCKDRRSIRYFDKKPLTKDEILDLLALAQLAPSVENLQPWKFHVILNEKKRHELLECCCYGNFIEGAGAFVVVTCDRSLEPKTGETLWNPKELEYSCVSAMENILLGATAMGLGSCWVSLHHGPVHDALQLPHKEIVVGGVMIGRLRRGEEPTGNGHERKNLEDVVSFYD
jgi:nitroreductase